jgi:hypothetical protein
MVSIASLWLPILLSAVLVFIASTVIHMVLKYHAADTKPLPNEGAVDGLRGVPPGVYMFPRASSMKEYGSPEMIEKRKRGPVGVLTLLPSGAAGMGKNLVQWFVFSILVSVLVAYICSRYLPASPEYMAVFRLAATVGFVGYSFSEATHSIWSGQPWSNTLRHWLDGLIYGALTAGVFGWLWPGRM